MACLMEPAEALSVREMIKCHDEFSEIEMDIGLDMGKYESLQSEQVPEGRVMVIFCVSCGCINMPDFFREMGKTLSQESVAVQRERLR